MSPFPKLVFITGGSTGIGLETVKALIKSSKASYHIFVGSRSQAKARDAVEQLRDLLGPSSSTAEPMQIDVTDDESIQQAAKYVEDRFGWLDVLINNAGVLLDTALSQDAPNFRTIFNGAYDVNVTGAQVTTCLFAPLLVKSPHARLVFLSASNAHLGGAFESCVSPGAPGPAAGWPKDEVVMQQGYRCSKAAVNMCMLTWCQILKSDGVKTFAVSPGHSATHLGGSTPRRMRRSGARDAALAGDLVRAVVEGERDAHFGRVVTSDCVQGW
ncbi:NAD(P)-binding domain protein [Metarhizium album ARSEF 1941]|uniref:NAD(P)-binding domain protein n=1 Tax=Metarhizium album (strain ARSEF 1941) TaxID=1081103 RepID=A0A0B2WUX0_METAS|nr:NAD(P)-binding domain protein [Metarhizium album ARSEF 1941]KHN97429.1 NAD(P)-binding domain protein [Metarhizium album ARSEF 1941]